MIEPIQSASLTDLFIQNFEKLIFSGYFKIGERLPPERELARKMEVSRPVVHEGLVDLVSKGLVTMIPRKGSIINDYRRHGSLFVLNALFEYGDGQVSDKLLTSMLDMRRLFEIETAGLAAANRSKAQADLFYDILDREKEMGHGDAKALAGLDFEFHHLMAMASENLVYPLLLNSVKQFYLSLTTIFFSDPMVVPRVFGCHVRLVQAIAEQQSEKARTIMDELLVHGESHLKQILDKKQGGAA